LKLIALISLFFIINILNADDMKIESSIYDKLIHAVIHTSKPHVYIYGNINSLENHHENIVLEHNCTKADIVVVTTFNNFPLECSDKILLGTKYSHTKDSRVLGAFFWQKGRPNIIFYQKRLEDYHVTLDNNLNEFIEK